MYRYLTGLLALALLVASSPAAAKDRYYTVRIGDLDVTEGALPAVGETVTIPWRLTHLLHPVVILDGPGEAYVAGDLRYWNWAFDLSDRGQIVVRAPKGESVTGELRLPRTDKDNPGQARVRFTIPASAAGDFQAAFEAARRAHYDRLLSRDLPGAAWFRLQRDGRKAAGDAAQWTPEQRRQRRVDDISRSYELLSGATALGENLQLDRPLVPRKGSKELVALDTVEGITVDEIDWAPLMPDGDVSLDSLAAFIPADQHALFFPTFDAMTTLIDEADGIGTPLLTLFEPRSQDANVKGRYQEQLALSMSHLARLLGPKVVRSVAFTGSDPFMRLGTDVAILFDASNPALLVQHIRSKHAAAHAAHPDAIILDGDANGLDYGGICTTGREVCSYLAQRGDLVIVTNSLAQLSRIADVVAKTSPALQAAPEYRFFRHRYPLNDGLETALLLLPDAAIRRWCGPRWRIADSRRVRAAAVLAHYQALHLDALARGTATELKKTPIGPLTPENGQFHSPVYGSLAFMTPVSEMAIDQATQEEVEAYGFFRDRYQRNWRDYFDPIAIRFFIDPDELSLDVSVIPLIAGSEYRELIELTAQRDLKPATGDPHPDALFRYGMSLNPDSRTVKQASGFALSMAPGFTGNALSWLGDSLVVYGDEDGFWEELVRAPKKEDFFEHNFHRLPVALRVAISSPMKATAFLASVRAFIEQTAPNMTVWETRKLGDLAYVRVGPSTTWDDDLPDDLAIYYAVAGQALTLTLNEALLKRALVRESRRMAGGVGADALNERADLWQGKQLGFQATGQVLELLEIAAREELLPEIQVRSWGNIPILNEWKRLFPQEDPVALHQRLWNVRLVCPGGGEYVWNDAWQTMESTIYGHPGQPTQGPSLLRKPLSDFTFGNFGLTFEQGGLRARATLHRTDLKRRGWLGRLWLRWLDRWPEGVRHRVQLTWRMAANLLATLSANRIH